MSTEQIIPFLIFAVVAAITPGPSNLLLAATGAQVGVRRGLPCLLGVALGMGLMLFLVALGLGSLVLAQPIVRHGLKWGGVAVLLWLAWHVATASRGDVAARAAIGFGQAAALQWVNPKSWLVSASAVGAYLHADASAIGQATWFGVLFILAAFPCCWLWLACGAAMQRFLRTERAARRGNVLMGLLLTASIVLVLR